MTTRTLSGSSTMQEVLTAYPAAQRALFRKYHIGGCSSCGFHPTDTLATVLANHRCQDPIAAVVAYIEESQSVDDKSKIDARQLGSLLAAKETLRLIDMRSPEETASGMIAGALLLTQELAQELQHQWAKDTKVVFYCQNGVRSADAVAYLAGHGFTNAWSLAGGIDGWVGAGLPTAR
jgi:rhodanese-related sulfurtransferase